MDDQDLLNSREWHLFIQEANRLHDQKIDEEICRQFKALGVNPEGTDFSGYSILMTLADITPEAVETKVLVIPTKDYTPDSVDYTPLMEKIVTRFSRKSSD